MSLSVWFVGVMGRNGRGGEMEGRGEWERGKLEKQSKRRM